MKNGVVDGQVIVFEPRVNGLIRFGRIWEGIKVELEVINWKVRFMDWA